MSSKTAGETRSNAMGSEDTVSFLASLQAENATLLARCEQLEKQVWEAEQERDRLASFGSKQEQAIKEHLLRCERAEADRNNLLARIHGDGGHYHQKYGTEKAVADAHIVVANRFGELREAEATVAAMKNLWHEADADNKAICDALHEGEHAFDPVAKAKALVTTVAACKAALKRVQAGFPSRSVDGGWGGSGDPAYADQVNKAIEAAEAARGGEQNA